MLFFLSVKAIIIACSIGAPMLDLAGNFAELAEFTENCHSPFSDFVSACSFYYVVDEYASSDTTLAYV